MVKPKPLIFVVDDDPIIRISLSKYLASRGLEVKSIKDGFDVLVLLENHTPDIIISDIRMDKLDGLSLLKGLHTRLETRDIPVIFMSAYADDDMFNEAHKLGAEFLLTKPFQMAAMYNLVQKILSINKSK